MDKKKVILIIVFVSLMASSGVLLFRSFSSQPVQFVQKKVSSDDIQIRSQVDTVKRKILQANRHIDVGGSLDQLVENPQFQALTDEFLRPIEVGSYGRSNPFVPPQGSQ